MKRISIIIPTKNRPGFLMKSLHNIEKFQNSEELEMIVVDDGSTRQMAHKNMEVCKNINEGIKYLFIEGRGPASARNMAIRISEAPILFFTGDDIIIPQSTLEEHLRFHKDKYKENFFAMTGPIEWDNSIKAKGILDFLDSGNFQFKKDVDAKNDVFETDFNLFYSSNLSVKRSFLISENLFFDERFPFAAWEDIELGYRCQKKGMKILYNNNAPVYHFHEQTISNLVERMVKSGKSLRIFLEKWPELSESFGYSFKGNRFRRKKNFLKALMRNRYIASLARRRFLNSSGQEELNHISAFCLKNMLFYHFHKGFMEGCQRGEGNA
ncbi:MAG: glycosyltransferase family 2 protein [Candidatus Schekmanbacteria bacterium]|nr:MAG: glycosyltransferase family 2 protein [Candidatus Schekmanbacteria bacterium]